MRSVTIRNYSLINWYQKNSENGPPSDILFSNHILLSYNIGKSFSLYIFTGNFYRNKPSKNCLSLILATDGKPLTVSTNSSICPVSSGTIFYLGRTFCPYAHSYHAYISFASF